MNILILGSGGREHTLAWKALQSDLCNMCYVAPGNAGTASIAYNIVMDIMDFDQVKAFSIEHHIKMVIVGPEAPLVEGIVDSFKKDPETAHISIIGPSAFGAQLEGSKAFAKKFMQRHHIPTAGYIEVNKHNLQEGLDFLTERSGPYVLKADGLAAGKGVLIIDRLEEAQSELEAMILGKFGSASSTVVIEEFLSGIEFSVFALTDGEKYVILPEAKDYKRIGEGDTGLNTGGMGAISPVPFVDDVLWSKVIDRIVKPTIKGLHAESIEYLGFVFFGLIVVGGEPYVIEYNCRLGDPETEVIIPRIQNDLIAVLDAAANGKIDQVRIDFDPRHAATVMLVSGGYPGDFTKGYPIQFPSAKPDSLIFHAGTAIRSDQILTSGGRVIAVTTLDTNFKDAVNKSKAISNEIQYTGKYFRTDIGFDL
jgi:phosphoribosylamine---glycine ligase